MTKPTDEDTTAPIARPRGGVDLSTRPGEKLTREVSTVGFGVPVDAIYSVGCAVCVLLLQVGIGMYAHARVVEDGEFAGRHAAAVGLLGLFAAMLALGGIVVAIVSWIKRPDTLRWTITASALNLIAFFADGITFGLLQKLSG